MRDEHAYPQSFIDAISRTHPDYIDPTISERFVGRGPINRMTHREVCAIILLCQRNGLASPFAMQALDLVKHDLTIYEGLSTDECVAIGDEVYREMDVLS